MEQNQQRREAIALFRYTVIAEVVTEPNGSARQRLMAAIARCQYNIPYSDRTTIGKRTLQRWVKDYQEHGLKGLEPQERLDAGQGRAIPPDLVAAAAALRRELPGRSVRQMIEILEMAGKAPRGVLKRSTLAEALIRAGCTPQALTQAFDVPAVPGRAPQPHVARGCPAHPCPTASRCSRSEPQGLPARLDR